MLLHSAARLLERLKTRWKDPGCSLRSGGHGQGRPPVAGLAGFSPLLVLTVMAMALVMARVLPMAMLQVR